MLKLSYIMGVYNGAKTIMVPLNSIYKQKMEESEFEVIIVDDCSTDDTVRVVQDFGKSHSNLKLICQKENHRLGAVRNVGVANAKGKYLQFIDADDEIGQDILPAIENALKLDADAQKNGCSVQNPDGSWSYIGIREREYTNFCEEAFFTDPEYGGTPFYLWKNEFVKRFNRHFVEDLKMEDTDWVEFYLANAEKVTCFNVETYKYVYSPNSITNTANITSLTDMVLQCYRRLKVADSYSNKLPTFTSKIKDACCYRVNSLLRYRNLTKFRCSDYNVLYSRIRKEVRLDFEKYNLSFFANIVLVHKFTTLLILYSTAWISKIGRGIVHKFRKY